MAQTLKEDVRKRIENAAINQLLVNGMHKTNMRDIAKEAQITPGNLYRYYASKDQLIISITGVLIEGLNEIVQKETGQSLNLDGAVLQLPKIPDNMSTLTFIEKMLVAKLRNALIDIGKLAINYPKRMTILLDDSIVSQKLYAWGMQIIYEFYNTYFTVIVDDQKPTDIMIRVVTMSFCEGVMQLLKALLIDNNIDDYIVMLDRFLVIQKNGIAALLKQELDNNTIIIKK